MNEGINLVERKKPFKRRKSRKIINKGDKFNLLTFVKEIGYKGRYRIGLWKCDCGKQKNIRISSVAAQDTTSCGCQKHMTLADNSYKALVNIGCKNAGCVNAKYKDYKLGAMYRDLPFDLSVTLFYSIIVQDCYYCEDPPSQVIKKYNSSLKYNGIDRIDNNLGYTEGNCVPCCGICNRMKSNMTQKEFLERCSKIYSVKRK